MPISDARPSDLDLFHALIELLNAGESLDKISTRHLLTQADVSKSTFIAITPINLPSTIG